MKQCLSCLVNPDFKCTVCKKNYCHEHIYRKAKWSVVPHRDICFFCWKSKLPKKSMKLSTMFKQARKLAPQGYLSVDISIDDHVPGTNHPDVKWKIYHERYNHSEASSPEEALALFKREIEGIEEVTFEELDKEVDV